MPHRTSNKELIFQTAVKLFAREGYENVTMREIAKEVGIKAASIYNHFASKEDLLDSIFQYFRMMLESDVFSPIRKTDYLKLDDFIDDNMRLSGELFSRGIIMDISRIVLREQFRNENIRQMLLSELIRKPREIYSKGFEKLMNEGKMRRADPILTAKEFHAYYIYRFYEISLQAGLDEPLFIVDEDEEKKHKKQFIEQYGL